jgi:hypothetical protein
MCESRACGRLELAAKCKVCRMCITFESPAVVGVPYSAMWDKKPLEHIMHLGCANSVLFLKCPSLLARAEMSHDGQHPR